MKIFLTLILAQIFLTVYVLYHVWHALSLKRSWRTPIVGLLIVEIILLLCGHFFYEKLNDKLLSFMLLVCGTWFIASIYFSAISFLLDIARTVNHFRPFFPHWIRKHYNGTKLTLFFFSILFVGSLLCYGYCHYSHPKITHQQIHIPKKAGGGRQSVRIAFAADIHIGYIVDRSQLSRYVDLINAQNCDIIMFGGDMIDYDLHFLNVQDMAAEFRRLQAPLGVYAILGNHEYRFDVTKKIAWLEHAGVTILRDSVLMPDLSFYLVGRDDKRNSNRKSLNYLLTGLDKDKPIIVANHQPTNIVESVMNQVDLEMIGHTHDGQIWPYNHIVKRHWDGYSYGYRKKGDSQFYISSGLGLSGPPFRIFTDSELVVFEILFL